MVQRVDGTGFGLFKKESRAVGGEDLTPPVFMIEHGKKDEGLKSDGARGLGIFLKPQHLNFLKLGAVGFTECAPGGDIKGNEHQSARRGEKEKSSSEIREELTSVLLEGKCQLSSAHGRDAGGSSRKE